MGLHDWQNEAIYPQPSPGPCSRCGEPANFYFTGPPGLLCEACYQVWAREIPIVQITPKDSPLQ
jgi:hypothetical protein